MAPAVHELHPGLDPVPLVQADHQAGLVVERVVGAAEGDLGGEVTGQGGGMAEVAAVPDEAVVGFAPEVGLAARRDEQPTAPVLFAP